MCSKAFRLITVLAVCGIALCTTAQAGLVAHWSMDDDGSGMVTDSSGNGRHGTLMGDAHLAGGITGDALAVDGTGDYAEITGWTGLLGTGAFSITAWVQTTANGSIVGWGTNTGSGARMGFRVNSGELRCEHGEGNIVGNTTMNDGEWHHVALTVKDAATIAYPDVKLWLNGIDDTANTSDPDAFNLAAENPVRIGSRPSNGDRFFNGLIDDVRIFDHELTQAEIQATAGLPPATQPNPSDDEIIEVTTVALSWVAGLDAADHRVYFGTSQSDVAAGAASVDRAAKRDFSACGRQALCA